MSETVVDSHVHFWDPSRLEYPWLEEFTSLRRAFLPTDHAHAMTAVPLEGLIFVEANPRPDLTLKEVRFIEELAEADPRIEGIVAFVDLLDSAARSDTLESFADNPRVRGVRHNIQGNPAGFALQAEFVAGVKEAGQRGLTFDLCATHDQLGEIISLARHADETPLVLDHCGKPGIREAAWTPWADHIRELASLPHVWCKVSGLLTEASANDWTPEQILPYARHVVECFGTGRVMYGSDWPVLTLAPRSSDWYSLTLALTADWSDEERRLFFRDGARRFYGITRSDREARFSVDRAGEIGPLGAVEGQIP